MSEPVISEDSNRPSSNRFFCHSCTVEIDRVSADYKCPLCSEGFIEELPSATENPEQAEPENDAPYIRFANDLLQSNSLSSPSMTDSPYFRLANEILSPMFFAASNRSDSTDNEATAHSSDSPSNAGASTATQHGRRRHQHHRRPGQINFENFLQEILISISDGANVGSGQSMFFMGNPGDYAWGREGLDQIVTQLLNQMDNSGPPPLDKDKIKEIPKVEITADQVGIKLQCSVCWEDFKLSETVRKLPCSHVYHESCIIPWLELHGTCPICRQSLAPECEMPDEQTRVNSWTSTAQQMVNQIRNSLVGGEHASTSGSSTSTSQSQAQTQPRHEENDPMNETLDFTISSVDMSTESEPANTSTTSSSNNANNSSNSSNSRMRDDQGNVEFEFD